MRYECTYLAKTAYPQQMQRCIYGKAVAQPSYNLASTFTPYPTPILSYPNMSY